MRCKVTNPTPISLNIDLYEDIIQKQFGMTVSEMLTNIEEMVQL